MIAPPPEGNVYRTFDPNITNPEAYGCAVAWWNYRAFTGFVLDQAILEMNSLQGVPM